MSPSWSKNKSTAAYYQDSGSIKRNETGSFVETQMEALIQSEVSQKEKKQIINIYM